MKRLVVNVATSEHTIKGQIRLNNAVQAQGYDSALWCGTVPSGSPAHADVPYAFKAFALEAMSQKADTLLWCDACILPIRDLAPVWKKIERDGYLLMRNGFSNYEWTADSAYPDLFVQEYAGGENIDDCRRRNRMIPHTVGGFFGLSMRHEKGRAFLAELYRLASQTRAFCGPWMNLNESRGPRACWCGPSDVRGHRHDQTAMSVIAWRLGMKLSDCPEFLVYGKAEYAQDQRTIVVADGDY